MLNLICMIPSPAIDTPEGNRRVKRLIRFSKRLTFSFCSHLFWRDGFMLSPCISYLAVRCFLVAFIFPKEIRSNSFPSLSAMFNSHSATRSHRTRRSDRTLGGRSGRTPAFLCRLNLTGNPSLFSPPLLWVRLVFQPAWIYSQVSIGHSLVFLVSMTPFFKRVGFGGCSPTYSGMYSTISMYRNINAIVL